MPSAAYLKNSGSFQPQVSSRRLAAPFRTPRGHVLLPSQGLSSIGGVGNFEIIRAHANYVNLPRLQPTIGGMGVRISTTNAGLAGDTLAVPSVTPTAKGTPLTTVFAFVPVKNGSAGGQGWLPTGSGSGAEGSGHVIALDEGSSVIGVGYDGGNGFSRRGTPTLDTSPWGRLVVVVISTHNLTKALNISVDGRTVPATTGLASYVGEGAILASARITTGNTAYNNYYNCNGSVVLWGHFPGLFLPQDTVNSICANPWQIFEDERQLVWAAEAAIAYQRALRLMNGGIQQIGDADLGQGHRPLVLYQGGIQQRVAGEGTPIILDQGDLRTLATGETLLI